MTLLLHLRHWYWKWQLSHARQFRSSLEHTIARERERAQDAVHQAEIMERRTAIAVADSRIARTHQPRSAAPCASLDE